MKPNSLYAQLELIPEETQSSPLVTPPATLGAASRAWAQSKTYLRQLASVLLSACCGSTEPRISVRYNRRGFPQYVVYDPITQRRYAFSSEQEVRTWLDQRYYQ